MSAPSDELLRAWRALPAAASVESARLTLDGVSPDARYLVLPLLMSVVDAVGRGERVEVLGTSLGVPGWLMTSS
jgi:hypothetical protein